MATPQAPAPASRRSARWSVPSAVGVVVVTVVALALGSGIGNAPTPSAAARAAAIDRVLRCPVCEDVSVADSQSSAAVAARQQVAKLVAEGQSDAQIEQSFVLRFGPSILLSPPDQGLSAVVWLLPLVAGGLAVVALSVFFVRRQRALRSLRGQEP